MNLPRNALLLSIFLALSVLIGSAGAQDNPEGIFDAYLGSLTAGDWDQAASYWLPSEVADTRRLGITYHGVPAKHDCASPVVNVLEGIRTGAVSAEVVGSEINGDIATVTIRLGTASESVEVPYYLQRTSDGWRLVSALAIHTTGWESRESDYVRVKFRNPTLINTIALTKLDETVESIAQVLGISDEDLQQLRAAKFDYYLCDEDDIADITGYPVHGMTSLPLDAIASRHLPHPHELVHLLASYRLRDLHLHTLPCLQEGLAVGIGGRWGKSPQVLFQLGAFMLSEDFADIDQILTYDGYHMSVGSLDISYALSGIMVDYLIQTFGMDRVLEAYLRLGGTDTRVRGWDSLHVQSELSDVFGMSWKEIKQGVLAHAASFQSSGILPGGTTPKSPSIARLAGDSLSIVIWEDDESYIIDVTAMNERPNGVILLRERGTESLAGYNSNLFGRHLPFVQYTGQRYGIGFTKNEAGLYDYATDNLLAKYVLSFWPSDVYWNPWEWTIRFRLDKSALPRPFTSYDLSLSAP